MAGLYGNSLFNLLGNCLFSTTVAPFYIPTSSAPGFQFLHFPSNTCYFLFFFFFVTILQGVNGYLIAILMCISIITTEVGCLFMPLLAICVSSLEKCLFISFAHLACLSSCFPVALYISGSAPCAFSHYVWPGSGGGVAAPVRRMSASSVHCCVPFVSGSAPRTQ